MNVNALGHINRTVMHTGRVDSIHLYLYLLMLFSLHFLRCEVVLLTVTEALRAR